MWSRTLALAVGALLISAPAALVAQHHPRPPRPRMEHRWDRREDRRDRREDIRDRREDRWDRRHHGGWRDGLEDRWDRREDRRQGRWDRWI